MTPLFNQNFLTWSNPSINRDTITPDFEDDFTTDKGWTETGTQFTIDTSTNNRVDGILKRTGVDEYVVKDLQDADALNGSNLDDDAFVIRAKLHYSGTSGTSFSSTNSFGPSSTSGSANSAQDSIVFQFIGPSGTPRVYAIEADNETLNVGGIAFATSWAPVLTWYIQWARTSTTSATLGLYSDDAYTTLIEEETITLPSTVQNLRYLKFSIFPSSNRADTMTVYFTDVKVWNGVTSVQL